MRSHCLLSPFDKPGKKIVKKETLYHTKGLLKTYNQLKVLVLFSVILQPLTLN